MIPSGKLCICKDVVKQRNQKEKDVESEGVHMKRERERHID